MRAQHLEQHFASSRGIRGEQPLPEEEQGERVDAGMAAELGTMKVSEEIEALEAITR